MNNNSLNFSRYHGFLPAEMAGLAFEAALAVTRPGNLFTTHTAVAAGFDHFSPALMGRFLGNYALLRWGFGASAALFQTGWFVESGLSATVIVLVVRTRRPFYRSRPGRGLAAATALVARLVLVLPATPLGRVFGFVPLPLALYAAILSIVGSYVLAAEGVKRWFYRNTPV